MIRKILKIICNEHKVDATQERIGTAENKKRDRGRENKKKVKG